MGLFLFNIFNRNLEYSTSELFNTAFVHLFSGSINPDFNVLKALFYHSGLGRQHGLIGNPVV